MPELPEVEAVRRRLERDVVGARLSDVVIHRAGSIAPQTEAVFRSSVRGARIEGVSRRAKHLFVHLGNGQSLHIHLRMTGNLYVLPEDGMFPSSARLAFSIEGGRTLVFDDPRCFGRVHVVRTGEIDDALPLLGPDALDEEFSADKLVDIARGSGLAAKVFLMDQSKIAGLGNIYAAEALFVARIHPEVPIRNVNTRKIKRLHGAVRSVLSAAIDCCERAYFRPGTFREGSQYPAAVYGREGKPCMRCGTPVGRLTQNGRSSYFCPRCQPKVL